MNGINLVPLPIRVARRRRRRVRLWSAATGVYTVVLLGSLGAFASSGRSGEEFAARSVAEATAHLQTERADLEVRRQKAAEAEREAEAAHMMGNHPDWSVLLGMLAKHLAPEMTIESCELAAIEPTPAAPKTPGVPPAPPAPAPAAPAKPDPGAMADSYKVTVAGLARTQSLVTDYALKLEDIRAGDEKLFEHVAIVEAKGRRIGATDVVAFKVECVLNERVAQPGRRKPK